MHVQVLFFTESLETDSPHIKSEAPEVKPGNISLQLMNIFKVLCFFANIIRPFCILYLCFS